MRKLLYLLLLPLNSFAQITDTNLNLEADTIRLETHAGRNTAQRVGRMFKNIIANKWNGLNFTTSGTSGPATFIGGVLNIPNYSSSSFITSITNVGTSGAATVISGVLNVPIYSSGTLPADAAGYLNNNGTGTLTWANVGNLMNVSTYGVIPYVSSTNVYGFTSVGTLGQVMMSQGGSGLPPIWTTSIALTPSYTSIIATGNWTASSAGYWTDRVGIVHLKGKFIVSAANFPSVGNATASSAVPNALNVANISVPVFRGNGNYVGSAGIAISTSGVISISGFITTASNTTTGTVGANVTLSGPDDMWVYLDGVIYVAQ